MLQANQFRVAEARGVEAVVAAMKRFPHQPTVQLSALLCFIPLALENIMMQVPTHPRYRADMVNMSSTDHTHIYVECTVKFS